MSKQRIAILVALVLLAGSPAGAITFADGGLHTLDFPVLSLLVADSPEGAATEVHLENGAEVVKDTLVLGHSALILQLATYIRLDDDNVEVRDDATFTMVSGLVSGEISAWDRAALRIHGDVVRGTVNLLDFATLELTGGEVCQIHAGIRGNAGNAGAEVSISGGLVSGVILYGATLRITGGLFAVDDCGSELFAGLHSRADIFGGDFSEGFTLTGAAGGFTPGGDLGGVINIFGGRGISQLSFELHPGFIPEPERPRINITGKDFRIDGLPVPFGIIDTFIYGELGGQLTGTLESGDALDARFTFPIGTNSRSIIDLIDCPEPSLPLLQAIGLAVLVALRRREAARR